jgi:DNA mismatch repair protein MutL
MSDRVIHILPEQVASQIAAGEVVERPASAVKELIENSLDAGARRITVEIEGGGAGLIAVADDGCGMSPHDAVLALRRHATSKIRDAADLSAIRSLGFRGEALASIASVSRLELRTRRRQDPAGTHLSVTGGEVAQRRECAMSPGTRIEARDLFFNTPARLKFLKSTAAEQAAAIEIVQRLALSRASLAFELRVDGRAALDLAPAAGLRERMRQLYGAKVADRMLPIAGGGEGLRIEGLASLSQESFPTARMLSTYVNGRAVRDRMLIRAITNAYATLLPRGRYPAVVVFITMRPQEVDVNVHPMKAEVRFRHGGAVFESLYRVLRARLADQTTAMEDGPVLVAGAGAPPESPHPPSSETAGRDVPAPPLKLVLESPSPRPAFQQQNLGLGFRPRVLEPAAGPPAAAVPVYSELRVLGQIFTGYIALESPEGLLLVDQHAAHERVTFERLKAQLARGAIEVQGRLTPETIEIDPARAAQVQSAMPRLRALGFDLEWFGPTTLLLKGTPAVFGAEGGRALLDDMIESLGAAQGRDEEGFQNLLKQLACHGSVRVGRILNPAEIQALLADLDRTPFKTNCPHGRPVHVRFPRGQIERMFRR